MSAPLVSIVIPCYGGEKYLAEAIESCLRQTHREIEVIVVDDASPDGSAAVADRYALADTRVRVIRHPKNRGVAEAFNTGFSAAKGEFMIRLAQDDIFREDTIERMLPVFRDSNDIGIVYTGMQLVDADGTVIGELPVEEPARALIPCCRIGVCVMWTRAVWNSVGPFDSKYDTAEDYEFALRVSRRFQLVKLPVESPFFFRYHPAQGGVKLELQQSYASSLAQLSHALANAKATPWRVRYWQKFLFASIRTWRRRHIWKRSPEWIKYQAKQATRSSQ